MTTPSSEEPVEPATSPVPPAASTPVPPTASPPPAASTPVPPPAPASAPAPPAAFAPVPRPPRTPWINPARRTHVVGAAIIAALVLIGAGFGIGYAAAPSGHRHDGPYRMFRGGYGPMMDGPKDGWFPGPGMRGNRGAPYPAPSAPATPARPTPTST